MTVFLLVMLAFGIAAYCLHLIDDRDKLQDILLLQEEKNRLLKELAVKHQLYITELENLLDERQKVNAELCKDIQITAKNIYAELERNRASK